MPKRSRPTNNRRNDTNDAVAVIPADSHHHHHHRRGTQKKSILGVCLLCTTSLMLFVIRFYQPTLSRFAYHEVKRIIVSKELEENSSTNTNNIKNRHPPPPPPSSSGSDNSRIAILSNFVLKGRDEVKADGRFMAHLINKACYADIWGYDFIYNVTWGFPDDIRSPNASPNDTKLCFLDFGHWHRVPQLIALMESNKHYKWILWTDLDYVFWDLSKPLESLLKEIELNNLHNIHVVVPDDGMDFWKGTRAQFQFSSFAVLFRNSHFSRTVLENWMAFAKGICPNGNFEDTNGCQIYNWRWADQMGLWYALGKTYSDLVEGSASFAANCNNQTGYLDRDTEIGDQMSNYFVREGLTKSSDYTQIPNRQPILWSSYEKNSRSGIGINNMFVKASDEDKQGVFGIHIKRQLKGKLQHSQSVYCGTPISEGGRGCKAGTNQEGVFDLSCGNTSFVA